MEFRGLITKNIVIADESIRINISADDSLESFTEKVKEALTVTDYRMNELGFRIFEDSSLIEALSPEELELCKTAARLLYPDTELTALEALKENVQFEFTKITAQGESVTLQLINADSYEDLLTTVASLFNILDQRLFKANGRQIAHLDFVKALPYEQKLKVAMVMDVLYGRALPEDTSERLKGGDMESYIQEQVAALKNNSHN